MLQRGRVKAKRAKLLRKCTLLQQAPLLQPPAAHPTLIHSEATTQVKLGEETCKGA